MRLVVHEDQKDVLEHVQKVDLDRQELVELELDRVEGLFHHHALVRHHAEQVEQHLHGVQHHAEQVEQQLHDAHLVQKLEDFLEVEVVDQQVSAPADPAEWPMAPKGHHHPLELLERLHADPHDRFRHLLQQVVGPQEVLHVPLRHQHQAPRP